MSRFQGLVPRQQEDLEFLRRHDAAALWHEVGVGKTHPVIVRMLELINPVDRRALIVVKRSLFQQWKEKIEDVISYLVTTGRAPEVAKHTIGVLRGGVKPWEIESLIPSIVLVNYDYLPMIEDWLYAHFRLFQVVILDEAHKIKGFRGFRSNKGVRAKILNRIAPAIPYRYAMSGSPLLNPNSSDLWAIYHFLDPNIFGPTRWKFVNEFFYNMAQGQPYERLMLKPGMGEELSRRMYLIARRVLKKDCPKGEFPEPRRIPYYVEMPDAVARVYRDLKYRAITVLEGETITRAMILGRLMTLQQVASGFLIEDGQAHEIDASHKWEQVVDILDEIGGPKTPVVIWAHFRHEIEYLERQLRSVGREAVVVYGKIGGAEAERRIKAFQNGDVHTILGHPAAAGAGLDLQRAQHAIRFSRSYVLEDFEQSDGRINRAFSEYDETIHHEVVTANTRDVEVYEALKDKKDLSGFITLDFVTEKERNVA